MTDISDLSRLIDGAPWTPPAILCEGCDGECGNTAPSAYFDTDRERFIALCDECAPIPFELA